MDWKNNQERYSETSGNLLINRGEMNEILDNCHCSTCGKQLETEYKRLDMDFQLTGKCEECQSENFAIKPQEIKQSKIRPKTAGLVQSCLDSGIGYAGFKKIVKGTNLDSTISNRRFDTYAKELHTGMLDMYEAQKPIMNRAVRRQYRKEGIHVDEDGMLDVAVSYDGSWLTRGHHSNIGAGFVIDSCTGGVLDYEVKSKKCQKCSLMKHKYRNDEEELVEKLQAHRISGECHKNYQGSSGGMEKACALDMWNRSEQTNSMRYTTFISDGDSSAYNAVRDAEPYGPDKPIEKQECINHVSKRLTARLNNLKQSTTVPKKTKTGKTLNMSTLGGKNKLSEKNVGKLSEYFSNNIRSNQGKSVESMKKSIYASYNHVTSSDDYPMHDDCPEGPESYCFIKKHEAAGTDEPPPKHSTMKVRIDLDEDNRNLVRDVYKDLCTNDLLARCLGGKTQNPNESFHSKVWNRLPKTKQYSLPTVKNITARTITEHNLAVQNPNIMDTLGFDITPSEASQQVSQFMEKDRSRRSKSHNTKSKTSRRSKGPQHDEDYGAGQHD